MTTNDDATAWQGGRLDLDAYLRRIGYDGELAPTLDVLRALTRSHITSIPFETVEIVLGRKVSLELQDVQNKLVHARRGGYCYEHNLLLAAALERVGFRVTGLASRVRIGSEGVRPATHAMLRVETAETPDTGKVWICDPGFGRNPIEPMELAGGAETSVGGWGFRLERTATETGASLYALRSRGADGWFDLHAFTLDQRYAPDWMVANHFMSTHARSPFAGRLVVQQMREQDHLFLDGTTLTTTLPDGTASARGFAPEEVPDLMREEFGLELPRSDHAELVARVYVARQAVAMYPATVHPPIQPVQHVRAHRPGRRVPTSVC
ncbi:arylamine N-acetyltransferase [Streptomyces sp. NBC_01408]|uniref:arylamine N-acetyltransferase family protein n=1 Tax=Streptomyces sp. NBC_01408 TaxID=2903855 RepID=UPI002254B2C0|nr:arylamine N-acetyltransferase [Streptomyces sp. NBC_01408]MCX4696071.1 arylamine N-acetyltransferase [Streptomyces sp. NBC_01408]